MTDEQLLERIVCDANILGGKPTIKGTRLAVDFILGLLAHDATMEEILDEYPGLSRADIQACLLFAAQSV